MMLQSGDAQTIILAAQIHRISPKKASVAKNNQAHQSDSHRLHDSKQQQYPHAVS